jgi:hypothetical protein
MVGHGTGPQTLDIAIDRIRGPDPEPETCEAVDSRSGWTAVTRDASSSTVISGLIPIGRLPGREFPS